MLDGLKQGSRKLGPIKMAPKLDEGVVARLLNGETSADSMVLQVGCSSRLAGAQSTSESSVSLQNVDYSFSCDWAIPASDCQRHQHFAALSTVCLPVTGALFFSQASHVASTSASWSYDHVAALDIRLHLVLTWLVNVLHARKSPLWKAEQSQGSAWVCAAVLWPPTQPDWLHDGAKLYLPHWPQH